MILIAAWKHLEDSATEPPALIYWADGQPATREDYQQHLDFTNTSVVNPDGSVQQIFISGLSGVTFYDTVEGVWKVRPEGEAFSLFECDPFATDHDIIAEIYMCPIVYSPKLDRTQLTQTTH